MYGQWLEMYRLRFNEYLQPAASPPGARGDYVSSNDFAASVRVVS